MRMVKVVPSFVNRDFSVPATSNLRPGPAQKRVREINADLSNKRRRVEQSQLGNVQEHLDPLRDQPTPTTESERSVDDSIEEGQAKGSRAVSRATRSHTGGSLVFVNVTQTGHTAFGPDIKEESPELGVPPRQPISKPLLEDATSNLPTVPGSRKTPRKRLLAEPGSVTPRVPSPEVTEAQIRDEASENGTSHSNETPTQDEQPQFRPEIAASPELDTQDALHRSPESTPACFHLTPPPVTTRRRDVYDVPSSPEFVGKASRHKAKPTYGRSPRTANTIQKEVDLLNSSRRTSAHTQNAPKSLLQKAYDFQAPEDDEIESTPQEDAALINRNVHPRQSGVSTPVKADLVKPARPGSLKKPSRNALLATSASAKRDVQTDESGSAGEDANPGAASNSQTFTPSTNSSSTTKVQKLAPDIQARLDRLRQRRTSSAVVVEQSSRRNSTQSYISAQASTQVPDEITVTDTIGNSTDAADGRRSVKKTASIEPRPGDVDTARLSVQPPPSRPTPIRSPVPLPENVRKSTPNGVAVATKGSPAKEADVFRKPQPKLRSSVSKDSNNASSPRHNLRSSENRRTSLQSEVPSSSQRPVISGTNGSLKPVPNSVTPHPASSGAPVAELETPILARNSKSEATPTADDAIVISSAEPSSSEYFDSEAERQDIATPFAREHNAKAMQQVAQEDEPAESQEVASTTRDVSKTLATYIGNQPSSKNTSNVQELGEGLNEDELVPSATAQSEPLNLVTVNNVTLEKHEVAGHVTPWNAESWNFCGVKASEATAETPSNDLVLEKRSHSPSPVLSYGLNGVDSEADQAAEADDDSRSMSPAVSTRSSPAVTRRPARFLSHSPTPEGSDGEDDSEEVSAAPSKATTPEIANDGDESESESDSSSNSGDSGFEDEDTEMPAVPAGHDPVSTANANASAVPSSPPWLHNLPPNSTLPISETSQPSQSQLPRKTPVPLPPNAQIPSSQSVSSQAATRRPIARYAGFRTLREQLADAKSTPTAVSKKPYDLRTMDLSKLIAKGKAAPGALKRALEDDSSDDESSSSSSDSD